SAKAGIELKLSGDRKTRTATAERTVWFEGEDRLERAASEWQKPNIEGPEWIAQDAQRVGPVQLCVTYAPEDTREAKKLMAELEPHCRQYGVKMWSPELLLPGDYRQEETRQARLGCD